MCCILVSAVLEVSLEQSLFVVAEGEDVEVCASFSDTPLDRGVVITFIVKLDSASGE